MLAVALIMQRIPKQSGIYTSFKPINGLEGWTLYPERPLSVVLGLGYEQDQAVGVVEYFDPSGAWAFIPHGADERFLADTTKSNKALWSFLEEKRHLQYYVNQPNLLYSELRGLTDVLSKQSRVIMVPAGPKIFSAIAILVALEIGDEVSLWRASAHESTEPSDTLPATEIVQFDYEMNKLQLVK